MGRVVDVHETWAIHADKLISAIPMRGHRFRVTTQKSCRMMVGRSLGASGVFKMCDRPIISRGIFYNSFDVPNTLQKQDHDEKKIAKTSCKSALIEGSTQVLPRVD